MDLAQNHCEVAQKKLQIYKITKLKNVISAIYYIEFLLIFGYNYKSNLSDYK